MAHLRLLGRGCRFWIWGRLISQAMSLVSRGGIGSFLQSLSETCGFGSGGPIETCVEDESICEMET